MVEMPIVSSAAPDRMFRSVARAIAAFSIRKGGRSFAGENAAGHEVEIGGKLANKPGSG